MVRMRHSLKRLEQVASLVIIVVFLLVIFLKSGLYYTVPAGHPAHAKTETPPRLDNRMVSPALGEYRLENPHKIDFSRGQSKIIDDILGAKVGGVFVDVGAGDGETNSVSLFFEKERQWRGVLVEANQTKHQLCALKNRRSQLGNFRIRINEKNGAAAENDIRTNELFELINETSIDLLIVNINGLELEFLRQVDFAKYNIRIITIELPSDVSWDKYLDLTNFLSSQSYLPAHHLVNSFLGKKDVLYKKS